MSIIEHGDEGALHVPADSLPTEKPRIEYVLDVCGGLTVLRLADNPEPMWKNPNPAERGVISTLCRIAPSARTDIPLEFLDREHIYD